MANDVNDAKGILEIGFTSSTLADPAKGFVNITPAMISDTELLAHPIRSLRTSVAGTLRVRDMNGDIGYIYDMVAGERFPCCITQIFDTGTDTALKTANSNGHTPLHGLY